MEQLAKQDEYKTIKFLNVAIEELPEVAQQHEIDAVPTVSLLTFSLIDNIIDFSFLGNLLSKSKSCSQNRWS